MNQPLGQRLPVHLIEDRAAAGHSRPYASIPKTRDIKDGFQDITYAVFANAINRTAQWLFQHVGRSNNVRTIAYIGPPDLRYHLLAHAASKTGNLMFFPSPRSTTESLVHMFKDADAQIILTGADLMPSVIKTIEQRAMHHLVAPNLSDLLDNKIVEHIPVEATFEQWRYRTWMVLHTSGSTGMPKLVPIKYGAISAVDTYQLIPESDLRPRFGNMRVFVPFPPFHVAGIYFTLASICWVDSTFVLPPPGVPLTADLVHSIITHGAIDHAMLAPSLIAELAKNPSYLGSLGKLKGLTFSGGPLSKATADVVAQRTRIYSTMGATEYAAIPMDSRKEASEYNYFKFNENLAGIEFRESQQPGLFELVFVRKSDYPSHLVQAIFVTYPELDEYHTKDCFSKHPTKPRLWRYEARLDDIIVLSNGEKLNPLPMEQAISTCPSIKGCLIVGQARFQTALLVEPMDYTLSFSTLLASVRPYVERANDLCPTHGRVSMSFIIIVPESKPLPRAPKGTIQRAQSNILLKPEIDHLYHSIERINAVTGDKQSQPEIDLSSISATKLTIRTYLTSQLGTEDFDDTTDFFDIGVDSLQVISLVRAINMARPPNDNIEQIVVYENSTVTSLTKALHSSTRVKSYSDFDSDDEDEKQTWLDMEKVYHDFRLGNEQRGPRRRLLNQMWKGCDPPPIFQPDGGSLAWIQVAGSFLINFNNWGLVNSFGVYQLYYETELLAAHSRFRISWIGTLQGTLLLVLGVLSGPLFDRGYFRPILIISSLGVSFGMMMLSLSTQYYEIMLSQGVLVGICLGLLYIPSVALIPLYFKRHRGLAVGLATSGGSIGGVVYPIVFRRIVVRVGFAWANRIMGFIALATLTLAILLIRPIGARSTGVRQLFDLTAFTDIPYSTFVGAGFLLFGGVLVPYQVVTSFTSTVTTDQNLTFYCTAILNAAQFFGRVVPAALSDYSKKKFVPGPELVLLVAEILAGVLGFCWVAVHSIGGNIAWLCIYGLVSGMIVTLPAVVLPYICPNMSVIGTRLGMLYAAAGIGFLISSPVAFAANAASHSFLGSQVWTGVCCLAGACFYATTAREAWIRRRLFQSRKVRF